LKSEASTDTIIRNSTCISPMIYIYIYIYIYDYGPICLFITSRGVVTPRRDRKTPGRQAHRRQPKRTRTIQSRICVYGHWSRVASMRFRIFSPTWRGSLRLHIIRTVRRKDPYIYMYLANGSVQIANGSVRILNFAGQLHQRRKSILPARKHGTSKRTRPYI
jgi:hypothetical protein